MSSKKIPSRRGDSSLSPNIRESKYIVSSSDSVHFGPKMSNQMMGRSSPEEEGGVPPSRHSSDDHGRPERSRHHEDPSVRRHSSSSPEYRGRRMRSESSPLHSTLIGRSSPSDDDEADEQRSGCRGRSSLTPESREGRSRSDGSIFGAHDPVSANSSTDGQRSRSTQDLAVNSRRDRPPSRSRNKTSKGRHSSREQGSASASGTSDESTPRSSSGRGDDTASHHHSDYRRGGSPSRSAHRKLRRSKELEREKRPHILASTRFEASDEALLRKPALAPRWAPRHGKDVPAGLLVLMKVCMRARVCAA